MSAAAQEPAGDYTQPSPSSYSRRQGNRVNYGNWSGAIVRQARAYIGSRLPAPCARCGSTVLHHQAWVVGHKVPRWQRPDLAHQPSNWQPEHRDCSDRSIAGEVIAHARAQGAAAALGTPFLGADPLAGTTLPVDLSPQRVDFFTNEPDPDATNWAEVVATMEWLDRFAVVPADATPPRFMSARHPRAVGTYGPDFLDWCDDHPSINARKSTGLRWWQELVAYRLLEHDAAGALVWRNVLVTLARQLGKSWLLRALLLWRIDVGADVFGEEQTCVHMAHKLSAAQEVWRPAARWAASSHWRVRFANGEECVESPAGGRWLIRAAMDGVGVGFSLSLLVVDEAWKIPRGVVEAADPALDESESPQMLVVSTAGDSSSDLFGTYRAQALDQLDSPGVTLLLEWSTPKGTDPEDEDGWRAASPHWTDKRRATIRDKLGRMEPLEFAQNYLNQWVDLAGGRKPTDVVVDADLWAQLRAEHRPGPGQVQAAALEAAYSEGVSLAVVADGVVGAQAFSTLADAVEALAEVGAPVVLAGKSIAADPSLVAIGAKPVGATSRKAVTDLRRLIDEGQLCHDGSEELTRQVLALRTQPGVDGPRVLPRGRVDAVKAAVWALDQAREVIEPPGIF